MKTQKLILAIALATGIAFAQGTTPSQTEIDAHRARIDAAIAARDYNAWKAEHEAWNPGDQRLANITADNFDKFAQMREARKSGDLTTAAQLRSELGIANGKGKGNGKGNAQGNASQKRIGKGNGSCDGTGSRNATGNGKGRNAK